MKAMILLTKRKIFTPRDFIVILCLLALSMSVHFFTARGKGERYAEISVNGHAEARIPLSGETIYTPGGLPGVKISVRAGAVNIVQSDCPDKICVRAGLLSMPGQTAACLPNRLAVRVTATSPSGADALDGALY